MKKAWFLVLLIGLVLIVGCTSTVVDKKDTPTASAPAATASSDPAETASSSASATQHQVVIEGFKFMPADIEAKVGDTVEWVNKDSVAHTVTIAALGVDENLPAGGTASVKLTQKGSFSYRCSFHPSMQGKVIVV